MGINKQNKMNQGGIKFSHILFDLFPKYKKQKLHMIDVEAQVAAINKSQAVIEFDMAGNILNANENFLDLMGYRLDEVQGKHHSIFVEDEMPPYVPTNPWCS